MKMAVTAVSDAESKETRILESSGWEGGEQRLFSRVEQSQTRANWPWHHRYSRHQARTITDRL